MDSPATIGQTWEEFAITRSPELRSELIKAYAPLTRFVVGRLGIPPTSLLDADDLVSYGMIGLITAIDRYDPARGIRFEAFATPRIRGSVIDQLRSLNWLPRSAMTRIRQIEQTLAELEQRLGRPAKEAEAAVALDVSVERYRQMLMEVSVSVLSLDAPLVALDQHGEESSLADLLEDQHAQSPAEEAEHRELVSSLSSAIERLPKREQLLLSLYYQEELTMKEISKVLGISESRVCQLHMQALMRMRGTLSSYHAETPEEAGVATGATATAAEASRDAALVASKVSRSSDKAIPATVSPFRMNGTGKPQQKSEQKVVEQSKESSDNPTAVRKDLSGAPNEALETKKQPVRQRDVVTIGRNTRQRIS